MSGAVVDVVREHALLAITTPLGPEVLIATACTGEEAISRPFRFWVDMLSARPRIDPDSLLNKAVTMTLRRRKDGEGVLSERHFNGIVSGFAATGISSRGLYGYRAEIVPRLWFASQTEDCRVFQNMTAVAIIEKILADVGVTDRDIRVVGDRPTREYTVQYNETDLAFITRLMEEEGYFYFFTSTENRHTLIIANANAVFVRIANAQMRYSPDGEDLLDCVTAWEPKLATAHGIIKQADYDPEQPSKPLDATSNTVLQTEGKQRRDVFHWPARTMDSGQVTARVKRRIEAAEATASLIHGEGGHEGFIPGGRFTMAAAQGVEGGEYVLQSVAHHASDNSWMSTSDPQVYHNSFVVFPAKRPWREPLRTPKPVMAGLYSAEVIGPSGEEIYSDKLGRVKVRFRWDHRRDATAEGSIWVRVVQPWTGNTWGSQFIPRVGTEVAVAFMDSDPDRPVVVGGLFNGKQLPTFPLPDQKTRSGLRTRSTPGGGSADFSELSFEDKSGDELVYLHAQKNLTVEAEHDETRDIGNNQTITVARDRSVTIKQGNDSLDVSMGNISIKADLGQISLEAMQSITLKVGENSVTISQEGVSVNGLMLDLQGQMQATLTSLMTSIDGSAMTEISGGVMMIG